MQLGAFTYVKTKTRVAAATDSMRGGTMHRIRLVGLAAISLVAIAAVAASSAAALPEYSVSSTFAGTSGSSTLETVKSGTTISCTADTNSGTVTGKTASGTFKVEFTGCMSGVAKCKSELSKKAGAILSSGTTTLGYINTSTSPRQVGILVKTETIKINCGEGALLAEVDGELICPITPVNTDTTAYTQKCEKSAKGVQTPKKFQTSESNEFLITSFGGGTFEESSLVTEEKLTNATLGEIKA